MQTVLLVLKSHVDILQSSALPQTGKRGKVTKTDRLKAIVAIYDMLAKKSTWTALTTASTFEMVRGPPVDESSSSVHLGWIGLVSILLNTLHDACDEALSSRTTAKSGQASIKPVFVKCFKRAVRLAMQDAPSGVIRPIVPVFLVFAHDYLGEPAIRRVLADDIWQCVRDILHDVANRAMLLPAFIRTWVDDCFQQLTGRGPMKHSSLVATRLAGELLQILASPVDSYDVLTQSSRAISPSKMMGGDFGYALICERSCLMLVVAESLPRRQARDLQLVSMQTLSIALTDHAIDVWDSSAVNSIINVAYTPILFCWMERKCHFAAVSLAKILLSIAPNNRKLTEGIRSRIRADVTDVNTSALVRAGKDVSDDYIDAAASCFSLREALEFASATNVLPGHVIIWLRVAISILTARTLKRDTSVLIDPRDVYDQCARATEVVSQILATQGRSRGVSFAEIIHWSCEVAKIAASIANRIFLASHSYNLLDTAPWVNLFQILRELLSSFTLSVKTVANSRSTDSINCEDSLIRAFIFLSGIHLLDHIALDCPGRIGLSQTAEVPFPLSRILSSGTHATPRDVELFRNLVARNGFTDEDGTGLRYRVVHALLSLCEGDEPADDCSADLFVNASAALVGVVRGECGVSKNTLNPLVSSLSDPETALLHEQFFSGLSVGLNTVCNNGVSLVKRMRDQDAVWSSHVLSICSQSKLYDRAPGMLVSRSITDSFFPSLSRHFSIPSNLSHKLESEMLSRMKETFMSLKKITDEGNCNIDILDDHDEFLYSDLPAMRKGLKLLVMVCNYLLEGLQHGLILTSETGNHEESRPDNLISLITSWFPTLIKIDMTVVLDASGLTKAFIVLCCNLVKVLQDESSREKWKSGSPWGSIYHTISDTLAKLSSNLCEHFIKIVVDSSKTNRKIIQGYADDRLINSVTEQSDVRRKRGHEETHQDLSKKRRRILSPGVNASSDEIGFQSDSEHDFIYGDDQHTNSDSESDDFGDESLRIKGAQQTMLKNSTKIGDRNGELPIIFDLLKVLLAKLPSVREAVMECSINGLNALADIERMLSPDGFERAALFSSLVDENCLQARKYIWDILFSVDTVNALIHCGRDVLKFGRYWKILESLSQSYMMFHVDPNSGKRKQYPLPQYLEDSRIDFLTYAQIFIERVQFHGLSRSAEYSSHADEIRRIVSGFLDVSEIFRTQHAFRMPRRVRLGYLKFGAALILFHNGGLLADSLSQSFDGSSMGTGTSEKLRNIQAAICKLLGDSEALVRFVAARIVTNIFSSWEVFPKVEVERVLEENLPPSEICIDDGVVFGTRDCLSSDMELTEVANQWNLTEKEVLAKSILQQSFQKVGSKSKGFSTNIALGEVCAAREDLLPYFYVQMSQRSRQKSRPTVSTYYLVVRICLALGLKSPRYLYREFSRLILPRLLSYSFSPEYIYMFPCEIALDENQYREGAIIDWLQDEQANILPHLLVQEKTNSLEISAQFAEKIGVRLDELLGQNVSAFAVVFPMQFTPGLHEKGQKLWNAINTALDGKIVSLLSKNKDEVIASLLLSTSSNFSCRNAIKDRSFDVERVRGFSRDTRSMRPPFYDPLVVASAIDHLHGLSPDTSFVPKNVLKGSLFNQLRDESSGLPVANDFPAFLKECRRPNSSLLRCLLTISKALDPTLTSQSSFNRLDAYFCVGLLWLMLNVHMLAKPANERKTFYRLLSIGFRHMETCSDAEWLLVDVQKKLLSVKASYNDFEVYDSDLGLREEDRDHLSDISTTQERQMYELVCTVCPVLVSVIVDQSSHVQGHLLNTAQSALTKLIAFCDREKFWTVILCNGAFPCGKYFKEARSVYSKALSNVEGIDRNMLPPILSSLKRFNGIYRQRHITHSIASGLSCLHELRSLLTDANVLKLSRHIEGEAWLRSNGEKPPTASLIRSSIGALVNVLRDGASQTEGWSPFSRNGQVVKGRREHDIEEQVEHVVADVLNTLGLLQQNSSTFVQTDVNNFSIPAKQVTKNYENIQDGVFQNMLCLVDVLRSGTSIASEAALNSLIAILQTADGKLLYNTKGEQLHTIASFQVSDRKGTIDGASITPIIGRNLSTGEVVSLETLPRFDDPLLWDLSTYNSQEGNNYESWMRQLCAALCLKCQSPANQALAGTCFTSYHLCRTVFPYLLMDIICDSDLEMKSSFSAFIVKYVMKPTQTPLDILRIFVRSLDVLCQVGLSIICQNGIRGWSEVTRTGKVSIPYLYLLDIPYSVAIVAALKCGATFSAIRYSHLYVDHKVMESEANIRGHNPETSLKRRHSSYIGKDPVIEEIELVALNKAKPWLRHAMMQISEMDGIRAFAPSDTLAESAVSLSNSDEEWFRSISALGVASRATHVAFHDSITSNSTPNTSCSVSGIDLRQEYASFRSLFGIGNLNIALHYWDGLLNRINKDGFLEANDPFLSNQTLVNKMNDLRYAAAWKLGLWESPNLITAKVGNELSENKKYFGFHHAIYRALHLIKTDRHSEIAKVLSSARKQILSVLHHNNWEVSTQMILEASCQLRVFQVLEGTQPGLLNPVLQPLGPDELPLNNVSQGDRQLSSGLLSKDSSNISLYPKPNVNGIADLELVLGDQYGIEDSVCLTVLPSRDAFSEIVLAEDLPAALFKCLGEHSRIARAAATTSARILFNGGSGSWARSACCLGTIASSLVTEASQADETAWKLQECRLKWTACDDARLRKQALGEVKETIFNSLGGKMHERTSDSNYGSSDSHSLQQSLSWETSESDSKAFGFLRSEACRLAANWSLDMKTHEPMDLFQTYLEPGVKAARGTNTKKLLGRAHYAMASFADAQIDNINSYRRSRKYEQLVATVKETEEYIERLKLLKKERIAKEKRSSRARRLSSEASRVDKMGKDLDYVISTNTKQARQDRSRIEKLSDIFKKWQVLACEHFAACLRDGTPHNLRVAFRMIAIWLDAGVTRDTITCALTGQRNLESVSGLPLQVPVRKLLPLAPQLFSRLNFSEHTPFQKTLSSTITDMASKYPSYSLWQLLALTNATRISGNEERMSSLYRGDKDKRDAAVDIFRRLESKHGQTVQEMKKVSDAYIALSESPIQKGADGSTINIARTPLLRLGELRHVSVPTVALPMHGLEDYCNSLPHIQGFDREARVCAGLSKPLKIKCIGSDGVIYPQIVKGRDDLRGDAVMEQMFTILNSLCENDREASRRNLYIRTYRIIPLSPFTGIMQFVKNTMQFKELLVDKDQEKTRRTNLSVKGSLHDRYRPNDMKHGTVVNRAFKDYENYKNNVSKRLVFMKVVWKELQPVFRYFFIEHWPDPTEWFTHQLNYSRSMAVMSIVGFILGLGDRHLSNILVDVHTGEIVHIDFGVAFEQGKLLPTPEHMPFRLTRDLVDGFGVSGVEGVFRRACEITLAVMRRYKDVLLTVVEVLLHDPMFNWALTPEEILREQLDPERRAYDSFNEEVSASSPEDSSIEGVVLKIKRDVGGSREAHRALNRISEKLEGLEGTERLSIEAHVARLIDEAQAFHVIAPVFPGWSPWL